MFLNVVCLLVGFLCLFVVLLMFLNPNPNRKTNGYLIIILMVVGLQRFLYSIEVLGFTDFTFSPLKIRRTLIFYIVTVYYLFFSRLISTTSSLKKELLHFILPTVFLAFNFWYVNYRLFSFFYLLYSIVYFIFIVGKVREFFYRKNQSILGKISNQAIKTWLLLMLAVSFSLIIYSNYFLFSNLSYKIILSNFYRYSSLIWFVILIYMFRNPIIIFGENNLLKSLQKNAPQDLLIWNVKPLKVIEEKDLIVYNAVKARIDAILMDIQVLQKSVPLITKITLTADTLAKELKIPRRHLELVFKYYCHYSINDFSNLVKINYAVTLINEGYLESYTVASLGERCLFNSRFTFSKNFKKFIGMSVSDFVNTNVNSKLFF